MSDVVRCGPDAPGPFGARDVLHPNDQLSSKKLVLRDLPAGSTVTRSPRRVRTALGSWRWVEGKVLPPTCGNDRRAANP
ncbi:hypothetical protein [Deinococcus peraridilitoris]|uniref:hypothetical protein n=1 Tax=Deinococcus peraridilitoris TaxID=432329 RepID=UPI0002F9B898|nr:hypothetical protein [Deinococcus peraridilitoris]